MGEVYRARDDRLNRLVAVKVLAPTASPPTPSGASRFIQEAQLASALQHPNIVTIFDIGSAEGGDYLAMELVRGRTLDAVIPHGRPAAAARAALRQPDRRRARRGPRRRHRPPRPQAGQHHGDRAGPDQGPRLRPGHARRGRPDQRHRRDRRPRRPPSRPAPAPSSAPSPTCRRSRPKASRSTRAPTSSRSARSSTRCSPACAPSAPAPPSATLAAVINLEPEPLAKVATHVPPQVDAARRHLPAQGRRRARAEHRRPQDRARRPARGVDLRLAPGRAPPTVRPLEPLRRPSPGWRVAAAAARVALWPAAPAADRVHAVAADGAARLRELPHLLAGRQPGRVHLGPRRRHRRRRLRADDWRRHAAAADRATTAGTCTRRGRRTARPSPPGTCRAARRSPSVTAPGTPRAGAAARRPRAAAARMDGRGRGASRGRPTAAGWRSARSACAPTASAASPSSRRRPASGSTGPRSTGVRRLGRPGVLAGRTPPRLHEDPRRLLLRRLPGRGRRRRQAGRAADAAAATAARKRASRCGRRTAGTCC